MCPLLLESPSHLLPHPTPLACHRAPALGSLHRTFNEYNTTQLTSCHFLDDITNSVASILDGGFSCDLGLREAGCQHVSFVLVRPGAFTARNALGHSQCGPEACLEPCEPRTQSWLFSQSSFGNCGTEAPSQAALGFLTHRKCEIIQACS